MEERDTREGRATSTSPHSRATTAVLNPKEPEIASEDDGPEFDGKTFNAKKDKKRLTTQLNAVSTLMGDGEARTLGEIVEALKLKGVHASEAGVSARLRDFRKMKFGGREVIKRRRGDPKSGLWEYILIRATSQTEHGEKWEGA